MPGQPNPGQPTLMVVEPEFYEVSYAINPWMRPDAWARDAAGLHRAARASFEALVHACEAAGARVERVPGAPGLPDMVFPANAAVVLDRRAVLARFRYPERRGEEAPLRRAFEGLRDRGLLDEVVELPPNLLHEGAGDCVWDAARGHFWGGHGPRSHWEAGEWIGRHLGQEVVPLELATARFYHLDTCFCPLSGGEVLYYPPAFTAEGLGAIRDRVPADQLIEADDADAAGFCVNAVNLGREVVMATPPDRLRARLAERGYQVRDVDLSPFILSGGGAYCMTLRLDRSSRAEGASSGRPALAKAA